MLHKTAVLTLNGNCPEISLLLSLREKSSFHLCTDGAYDRLKKIGIIPDAIIGDMDSLKGKVTDIRSIENPDQMTSDFEKALIWLIEEKYTKIYLTGLSGGRLDHQMVNLTLFTKYSEKLELLIYDDNQAAQILNPGTFSFNGKPGQIISLLSVIKSEGVTLTGTEYLLNGETLSPGSRGLSNRFVKSTVHLSFSSGKIIVITQLK